jgi:hypothetical protein
MATSVSEGVTAIYSMIFLVSLSELPVQFIINIVNVGAATPRGEI